MTTTGTARVSQADAERQSSARPRAFKAGDMRRGPRNNRSRCEASSVPMDLTPTTYDPVPDQNGKSKHSSEWQGSSRRRRPPPALPLSLAAGPVAFLRPAMRLLLVLLTLLAPASLRAATGTRLKDIVSLEGVRDNQLVGYGLVVGLNGTGDKRQTVFSAQALTNILQRMGVSVNPTAILVRNMAKPHRDGDRDSSSLRANWYEDRRHRRRHRRRDQSSRRPVAAHPIERPRRPGLRDGAGLRSHRRFRRRPRRKHERRQSPPLSVASPMAPSSKNPRRPFRHPPR